MFFRLLTLILLTFPLFGEVPTVLVSIAPYRYFVERLGGDAIHVEVLVPPGGSPHTYEPTAKQLLNQSQAALWFRIGEAFEEHALPAMKSANPKMEIVDLRDGLSLICEGAGKCTASNADPHIWLSPKMAKQQVKTIAQKLKEKFPAHALKIDQAEEKLIHDLEKLDQTIENILASKKGKTILVSHPAYAYFVRDYGLNQLSIETEGREASAKKIQQILNIAKKEKIKTIFAQVQHSTAGAKRVSLELQANVILLDPLNADYIDNLIFISKSFAGES